jgi:hypothetical protein
MASVTGDFEGGTSCLPRLVAFALWQALDSHFGVDRVPKDQRHAAGAIAPAAAVSAPLREEMIC